MIQRRNMLKQALLYIITFSLYGIYWFYVTPTEMVSHKGLSGSPGLWTILLFLGPLGLCSYWQQSKAVQAISDGRYSPILIFILWIFFSPAVWAITHSELNRLAGESP